MAGVMLRTDSVLRVLVNEYRLNVRLSNETAKDREMVLESIREIARALNMYEEFTKKIIE